MHFVTFGQKKNPAIVFLHGWGGSIDSWIYFAKTFSYYGFFCVVVDFPGFGQSPEPTKAYSVYDYANEVSLLINKLDLKDIVVVGHSFGGRIGIVLSGFLKLNITKLVLVDSAGIKPRRGIGYYIKVKKYKKLKSLVAMGKKPKEVLEKYGSDDYRQLSLVMKETFVKVVNEDLLEYAKQIKISTLIVWGDKDKDTPLYMAKKLKRAIKGAEMKVYAGGHYSYLDNKKRFIDDLYTFLMV